MKRLEYIFACAAIMLAVLSAKADNTVIENGKWKITYVEESKAFKINYRKADGSFRPLIINSLPEASYDKGDENTITVKSSDFPQMEYNTKAVNDEFGTGVHHIFTFTGNSDGVIMQQHFGFYDAQQYIVTGLKLICDGGIRSNYLAPIATSSAYVMYVNSSNNRMLKVPFDNDGFVRYQRNRIDCDMTSYEVSAIYEGESRNGLILGSVDHDHWKSAVTIKGSNNGKINSLKVFSGISDSNTRDLIPHGKLEGDTISSARMFIGFYDDWRDGMEEFCAANNLIVPKRDTWEHGTPFGWQSWGVMAEKNSFATDIEISDYYNQVLQPGGFINSKGNIVFSLDASDGMNSTQHMEFIAHAAENGQMTGCYSTPFSLWWKESELDNHIYTGADGTKYKMRDVVLHVNGKPHMYDGAFCRDPTHPATKSDMNNFMRSVATYGYKYIKCDFTNCGIIQADSYYDKNVKTAVEAYNQGMKYLIKQADKYGIFIAFSISPLFPYQYANSRRIACDTWGTIGWSEYSMNAITAGWWTDGLYQYNDPDHIVLIGNNDQLHCSEGENRARYTNGAVTGMMLVADNFSLNDKSGRGNAVLSRTRAGKIMFNKDINAMADLGRSFRPVYGYKEHNGYSDGAESFVMHHTDKYLYVAIINYNSAVLSGKLPLDLLDITSQEFSEVKELWTGDNATISEDALQYSVPQRDARVYRFKKNNTNGIDDNPTAGSAIITIEDDYTLTVSAASAIDHIALYNSNGTLIAHKKADNSTTARINIGNRHTLLITRIVYKNGEVEHIKKTF